MTVNLIQFYIKDDSMNNTQSIMAIHQLFIIQNNKQILVGYIEGNDIKKGIGKIYKNTTFIQEILVIGEQMIKKISNNDYRSLEVKGKLLFSNDDLCKDNWTLVI